MRISGYETTVRKADIDVDARALLDEIKKAVFKENKMEGAERIEDGKIVEEVENHGHKSYFTTETVVGRPTKKQLDLLEAFNLISQELERLKEKR